MTCRVTPASRWRNSCNFPAFRVARMSGTERDMARLRLDFRVAGKSGTDGKL
jgi:hypothetical protein